jgi:hypothetical protein
MSIILDMIVEDGTQKLESITSTLTLTMVQQRAFMTGSDKVLVRTDNGIDEYHKIEDFAKVSKDGEYVIRHLAYHLKFPAGE